LCIPENEKYKVVKQLGEGSYAKVWQVIEEKTKRQVALKIQKPSWQWEFYICREIQLRLENKDLVSRRTKHRQSLLLETNLSHFSGIFIYASGENVRV